VTIGSAARSASSSSIGSRQRIPTGDEHRLLQLRRPPRRPTPRRAPRRCRSSTAGLHSCATSMRARSPAGAPTARCSRPSFAERWALEELRAWQWNLSVYNVAGAVRAAARPDVRPARRAAAPLQQAARACARLLRRRESERREPDARAHAAQIDQNRGALEVLAPISSHAQCRACRRRSARRSNQRLPWRAARSTTTRWLEALDERLATGLAPRYSAWRRALRRNLPRDPVGRHGRGALPRARREGCAARA
jgi:hypothetical protein